MFALGKRSLFLPLIQIYCFCYAYIIPFLRFYQNAQCVCMYKMDDNNMNCVNLFWQHGAIVALLSAAVDLAHLPLFLCNEYLPKTDTEMKYEMGRCRQLHKYHRIIQFMKTCDGYIHHKSLHANDQPDRQIHTANSSSIKAQQKKQRFQLHQIS